MKNSRTDAPLIKHLATSIDVEAARVYSRLPLFLMPAEADELIAHEADLLAAAEIIQLPFEDFILEFSPTRLMPWWGKGAEDAINRGRSWVRVRRVSRVRADRATRLHMHHLAAVAAPDKWVLLEGWEERTTGGGFSAIPGHTIASLANPGVEHRWHAFPNPECPTRVFGELWCNLAVCPYSTEALQDSCIRTEVIHSAMSGLAILACAYITEGLGGLTTEVRRELTPREVRAEKVKPWLAPRRSTYILIDPARVGEYGHPSGARGDAAHASPIPHARRGHWRRLEDRRTWVRPAWVGVSEWQSDGRSYIIRR